MTILVPKYDTGSTGAVNRPFNVKLNETVSATDFGADPTGVASSTTAFSNALDYLNSVGGGTLLIPPGQYKGLLQIKYSNIHVIGYGATIGVDTINLSFLIEPPLGTSNLSPFLGFNVGTITPTSPAAGAIFYPITSVTQGANVISMPSTSGIAEGDYGILIGKEVTSGSTTTTNFVPNNFDLVKVVSTTASSITVETPFDANYSSANPYTVFIKWDIVHDICVEGIEFTNIYGGAYCTTISGARDVTIRNCKWTPASAWGAVATSRRVTFDNCHIINANSGYSTARMSDEILFTNCSVTCNPQPVGTSQYYFIFAEENIKRLTITDCIGINAKIAFYIGNGWTNISVKGSRFDMILPNMSALTMTTFEAGGIIKLDGSVFTARGGTSIAPWDVTSPAVCAFAYTQAAVLFTGCTITQLGAGIEIGNQYFGSNTIDVIEALTASNAVGIYAGSIVNAGSLSETAITTVTAATYVVTQFGTNRTIICNFAGTITLSLPLEAGRKLSLVNQTANTVVNDSASVVPLGSTGVGTAILAATAGKWCELLCDGTKWFVIAAN
jgi:hypothetical protein